MTRRELFGLAAAAVAAPALAKAVEPHWPTVAIPFNAKSGGDTLCFTVNDVGPVFQIGQRVELDLDGVQSSWVITEIVSDLKANTVNVHTEQAGPYEARIRTNLLTLNLPL